MLPTPPEWSDDEVALVNALHGCGTHSLLIPYDATPHRLIASGWVEMWPGLMLLTFKPLGARALGLTLDGEPSRWCTRKEVAALKPERGTNNEMKVVNESDQSDAGEREGGVIENRRIVEGAYIDDNGDLKHSPRQDGGLMPPLFVIERGPRGCDDWNGPNFATCPVCGDRDLKEGEYCCRHDGHWQDKRAKTERKAG